MRVALGLWAGVLFVFSVSAEASKLSDAPISTTEQPHLGAVPGPSITRALQEQEVELDRLRREAQRERALGHEAERLGIAKLMRNTRIPDLHRLAVARAIVREAKQNGLDPFLVVAVIRIESSFNTFAISPVGAVGLMQVMPETGRWLLAKTGDRLENATDLFDFNLNIKLGTRYLAQLIKRFGSVDKALVAYNAGPTAARRILKCDRSRGRFMSGYPKRVVSELRTLRSGVERRLAKNDAQLPAPRAG